MQQYRCKHKVEAMQWVHGKLTELDSWHQKCTGKMTQPTDNDNEVLVACGDLWQTLKPTEWLIWSDGEFMIMENWMFIDCYEPVELGDDEI